MLINLTGVFNFFIVVVELVVIGALIFAAIDFIATDDRFKKIAKLASGGVLVVLLLFAIQGVFTGGGKGMNLTPLGFLYFAVGVILTLIVWYVLDKLLDYAAANWFKPLAGALDVIKFVLAGLVLVVILLIAANVLFGAAMGGANFRFSTGSGFPAIATLPTSPALYLPGVLTWA
jgi:hypothetical protein